MDTTYLIAAGEVAAAPAQSMTLIGALVAAISVLSGVCVFLFLRYDKRNDQIAEERKSMEKEREQWRVDKSETSVAHERAVEKLIAEHKLEEQKLKVEHEKELRDLSEKCMTQVVTLSRESRDHDVAARSQYAGMLETMADRNDRQADVVTKSLEKLTDNLLVTATGHRAPTSPGGGRYGHGKGGKDG